MGGEFNKASPDGGRVRSKYSVTSVQVSLDCCIKTYWPWIEGGGLIARVEIASYVVTCKIYIQTVATEQLSVHYQLKWELAERLNSNQIFIYIIDKYTLHFDVRHDNIVKIINNVIIVVSQ